MRCSCGAINDGKRLAVTQHEFLRNGATDFGHQVCEQDTSIPIAVPKAPNEFASRLCLFRQSCAELRQAGKLLARWRAANKAYNRLAAFGNGNVFASLDHCNQAAQLGFGLCQSKGMHDFLMSIEIVI
jgi:hypothetical protein